MFKEAVWNFLERTADHPAQAYLFAGNDRVGKREIAERFSSLLLKIPATHPLSSHPDFLYVTREEGNQDVNIKQARALVERLQMTSACGGFKIALVADADRLNDQAANALLKAVEEPSAKTVYFFLAERVERLPATLRSRMVALTFDLPVSERAIRDLRAGACVRSLATAPLGRQLAELEDIAKSLDGDDDAEGRWRDFLDDMMRAIEPLFREDPATAARIGRGLCLASTFVGSPVSPRLGLEWMALQPYSSSSRVYPSFLTPSYL